MTSNKTPLFLTCVQTLSPATAAKSGTSIEMLAAEISNLCPVRMRF